MNEIEKMAKALYGHYCGEDKCGECKQPRCADYIRADRLVNAGYGDVKQAVRDFAEKVKKRLAQKGVNLYNGKSQVIQIDMQTSMIIDELVKEVCGE